MSVFNRPPSYLNCTFKDYLLYSPFNIYKIFEKVLSNIVVNMQTNSGGVSAML